MDTIIVITSEAPRDSDVVQALRDAGLRVLPRRVDDPVDELARERPDVVVVDVPDDRRVQPMVTPVAEADGLDGTPLVLVVGPAGLSEAASLAGDGGVADWVLRPLRAPELVERVRAPLRAAGRGADDKVRVGRLVVDVAGFEATLSGKRLDLTYQEFELLKFLVLNPDRAYTRDQLLARVWGYDYYGGSRTVDIHIRRIRAKLGHPYAACIQTIRHVGYKWVNEYD